MAATIRKKVWPEYFEEILSGRKKFELRLADFEVRAGEDGALMPVKEYYAIRKAATNTDGWIWERKEQAMRNHFDKVMWADAILVLNHDKNNVSGYIGANTLLEMGLAFHHKKRFSC